MAQDTHQQALEEFEDAREGMREQYDRMRADLRFSDPTDPQQWDKQAQELRKGRPCLTFDRTNQFIAQVVNSARQNKPSIHCLPANSDADIDVAEQLNGIVRHIEYVSRAGITYDTAIEHAARIGLGWMRVIPEIMRPETNEQEIRIKRIADPLSAYLEAGWSEPDGSDAMVGFIESMIPAKQFKAQWPKAETDSWEKSTTGWFDEKMVRICERFKIIETKTNRLTVDMSQLGGQSQVMGEEEYWQMRKLTGAQLPADAFVAKIRTVKWSKLSGCEVLEETDFPSQYLPLIPVIGHELIVDGRRHLCGMTRRLMDSQRAYNYERSAFIESVSMQPKAPLLVPVEAMNGLEGSYASLNQGNPAFLPYNHSDDENQPIPAPTRLMPPTFPVAFAQGGQIASTDMESAVGMFRANLGQPGSAISGRAKREDKVAGDTANFHYTDNLARSIEQLGRVVVDMIPKVYDTARQARIVHQDGKQDFVQINPEMREPVQKKGKKVTAINPGVGAYDVRVKTGPAYTTLREEQAEQLANIMQAAPNTVPILADLWVAAQDFPDAEKATKRLAAMLPPEIQQMEHDDGEEIPPAVMAQLKTLSQAKDQLEHALQQAMQEHEALENQVKAKADVAQFNADALSKREIEKHAREIDFEKVKAAQTLEDNNIKLQIARMNNDTARINARLTAEVALAAQGTDQAMASQALDAEQILEGKRMAVDMTQHNDQIAAQAQQHTEKMAAAKTAKAKPKVTA